MHVLVRPLTDADYDALKAKRPGKCRDGTADNNLRFWIVRYPGFLDALVTVWAPDPFAFESRHVWFPDVSVSAVKAWVETLPAPKVAKKREAGAA